jgi:WD40 repeat protein
VATLSGSHPLAHVSHIAFSPDNQWLVVGSAMDYRWWRVGSWEPDREVTNSGGVRALAFSRDGSLLAITNTPYTVQLVDPLSGQELATLTAADRHVIQGLCFNDDGSQLAASTPDQVIQLWDLRLLRDRLADLSLDWDLPPYEAMKEAQLAQPLEVHIEGMRDEG